MIAWPFVEKIGEYSFNGFYMQEGEKGLQGGNLSQYSDGKLIGIIQDKDKYHQAQKIILGRFELKSPLRIMKVAYGQNPILWQFPAPASEDLTGRYEGSYLFNKTTDEFELALALFHKSEQDISRLLKMIVDMPIEDFDEELFDKFNNPTTEDNFRRALEKQYGELIFRKI